jgi:hypothetical protein
MLVLLWLGGYIISYAEENYNLRIVEMKENTAKNIGRSYDFSLVILFIALAGQALLFPIVEKVIKNTIYYFPNASLS